MTLIGIDKWQCLVMPSFFVISEIRQQMFEHQNISTDNHLPCKTLALANTPYLGLIHTLLMAQLKGVTGWGSVKEMHCSAMKDPFYFLEVFCPFFHPAVTNLLTQVRRTQQHAVIILFI